MPPPPPFHPKTPRIRTQPHPYLRNSSKAHKQKHGELPTCIALSKSGTECLVKPTKLSHRLCKAHHEEYLSLYAQYKKAEGIYERLDAGRGGKRGGSSMEKMQEKYTRGKEVIALRDEVNRRFFSGGGADWEGNRRHVRWILKLREEVNAIGVLLSAGTGSGQVNTASISPTPTSPEALQAGSEEDEEPRQQLVHRSLLSPEVSMSDLAHLPHDSLVREIKQILSDITNHLVEKLYSIAPSLNDSSPTIKDSEDSAPRDPDAGDYVVRFVLREVLIWKADSETLAFASKTESINAFLRQRPPSEIEVYIKFFEAFGGSGTLRFLRDAVCDYLLPQASGVSSSSSTATAILGGVLVGEDEDGQRKMPVEGWDILYSYFGDLVAFHNVESFCFGFEDVLLVKRLIALKRYGDVEDADGGWLNLGDDVSQESLCAVLLGFVALTKGYTDSLGASVTTNDGETTTEAQSRCYVVGRMAKTDRLAQALIQELGILVARFTVIIYDSEENPFVPGKIVSQGEEAPWIRRTRSARVDGRLDDSEWQVEMSLEDILGDIAIIQRIRGDDLITNYYQFVIIDRLPGREFAILDEVADVLLRLTDDSLQDILTKAVRESIPSDQQDQWLEAILLDAPPIAHLTVPDVRYEGSRVRAWDVMDINPDLIRCASNKRSQRDARVMAKIAADMESHGLVTLLKKYEKPHTCPIVLQAADGLEDLYFDYNIGPIDRTALLKSPLFAPEVISSPESLYEFARTFQARHPNAVFAKGRIHVHYCAWPMSALESKMLGIPNFRTVDGHLYQWKVLPFDFPLASHMWQYYIHCEINRKVPFARGVQTTFVVCAARPEDAEGNLSVLLAVADSNGWNLSVASPALWVSDVEDLGLKTLWAGVYPEAYRRKDHLKKDSSQRCIVQ